MVSTRLTKSSAEMDDALKLAAAVSPHQRRQWAVAMPMDPRWPEMLLQPDSRPISQEQLAAEVKVIYFGLTTVESKCIHVCRTESSRSQERRTDIVNDHWQAMIALHKTLLHEHHDFLLASHHPSASPALRKLVSEYHMPARMWKHGIHSLLELLRWHLPASLEFMTSFICAAYQMMALLYETVSAFRNIWIEGLGDLARYRMAIEVEDLRERENWTETSRYWYERAADSTPEVGRLYHHLAILARPNALQQLFLYGRSMISVQIFTSARQSIRTLFSIFLTPSSIPAPPGVAELDVHYVKCHALLFLKEQPEAFKKCQSDFLGLLNHHIGHVGAKWREQGAWVAVSLLTALFDYGNESPLRKVFDSGFHSLAQPSRPHCRLIDRHSSREDPKSLGIIDDKTQRAWDHALSFTVATASLVFARIGDRNVLPFVHILLAFILSLSRLPATNASAEARPVIASILQRLPSGSLCTFLSALMISSPPDVLCESTNFIQSRHSGLLPLPEEFVIRGQVWSQDYFPVGLFRSSELDGGQRNIEHASTMRTRINRVLNLGYQLAQRNIGMQYDGESRKFYYDEAQCPPVTSPVSIRSVKM